MVKRKDTIQLEFSIKVYAYISQYTNKPIIGLSDEVIESLEEEAKTKKWYK